MYVEPQHLINQENKYVNIILLSLHMLFSKEEENVVYCQFVQIGCKFQASSPRRNKKRGSYELCPANEEELDLSEVWFCVGHII